MSVQLDFFPFKRLCCLLLFVKEVSNDSNDMGEILFKSPSSFSHNNHNNKEGKKEGRRRRRGLLCKANNTIHDPSTHYNSSSQMYWPTIHGRSLILSSFFSQFMNAYSNELLLLPACLPVSEAWEKESMIHSGSSYYRANLSLLKVASNNNKMDSTRCDTMGKSGGAVEVATTRKDADYRLLDVRFNCHIIQPAAVYVGIQLHKKEFSLNYRFLD